MGLPVALCPEYSSEFKNTSVEFIIEPAIEQEVGYPDRIGTKGCLGQVKDLYQS